MLPATPESMEAPPLILNDHVGYRRLAGGWLAWRAQNLMPSNFDLAVIGSGMGGAVAADAATDLGARVALIERDRIGGT